MRYHSVSLIILLLANSLLPGKNIDKLKQDLQKANSDRLRAELLADIAYEFRELEPDSALYYAEKALPLARQEGYAKYIAYSLSEIGSYYRNRFLFDSAFYYFKESLRVRRHSQDRFDVISGYHQLGTCAYWAEEYPLSITYLDSGLTLLELSPNVRLEAKLLSTKGMALFRQGAKQEGFVDLERSLASLELLKDSLGIAKGLQNLGNLYRETGQFNRAKARHGRALEIFTLLDRKDGIADALINLAGTEYVNHKYDSAEENLLLALKITEDHGYMENLSPIYNNLALIYVENGDLSNGEKYHQLDLALARKQGLSRSFIIGGLNLVDVMIQKEDFTQAMSLLDEVEDSIRKAGLAFHLSRLTRLRAEVYAGLEEFEKAFIYDQKANGMEDSLTQIINQTKELSDLIEEERLEKERIRRNAVIQNSEFELEKERSRTQYIQTLFIATVIVLTFLFILAWQNSRWQKLKAQTALSREREAGLIKDKKILGLTRESELKVLRVKMDTQDRERKRIARDLHDRLGSVLAVVQMHFTSIQRYLDLLPKDVQGEYAKAEELLDSACETVREVSHNLEAGELSLHSLETVLNSFCKEIDQVAPIQIQFYANNIPPLIPKKIEQEVLSMARTLVENILRHSEASQASIQMFYEDHLLRLTVEDDGKGFDELSRDFIPGMGLRNVRIRTEALGGTVEVDSNPQQGCLIHLQIPIEAHLYEKK